MIFTPVVYTLTGHSPSSTVRMPVNRDIKPRIDSSPIRCSARKIQLARADTLGNYRNATFQATHRLAHGLSARRIRAQEFPLDPCQNSHKNVILSGAPHRWIAGNSPRGAESKDPCGACLADALLAFRSRLLGCPAPRGELTENPTSQGLASRRRQKAETAHSTEAEKGHLYENAKIKAAAF